MERYAGCFVRVFLFTPRTILKELSLILKSLLVRVTLHLRKTNQMGEDSCYRGGIVHSPVRCSRKRSVRRESPKALFQPIEAAQAAVRLLFACLLFLLLSSSSSSSFLYYSFSLDDVDSISHPLEQLEFIRSSNFIAERRSFVAQVTRPQRFILPRNFQSRYRRHLFDLKLFLQITRARRSLN